MEEIKIKKLRCDSSESQNPNDARNLNQDGAWIRHAQTGTPSVIQYGASNILTVNICESKIYLFIYQYCFIYKFR